MPVPSLPQIIEKIGDAAGTAADAVSGVVFKSFAAVKSFAAKGDAQKKAEELAAKKSAADAKAEELAVKKAAATAKAAELAAKKAAADAAKAAKAAARQQKSKFGAFCAEPNPADCQKFGSVEEFGAVDDATVAANDADAMRLREAAYRKAAEEAESGHWQGGSWDRLRRNVWHGEAEDNLPASSAPATYQQAILSQPIPMLSPIRGTNQPQGVRAIVDATTGTTTTTYNPNLPALAVAIPSNATAGSLSADVKVNVVGGGSAAATSKFASLFD